MVPAGRAAARAPEPVVRMGLRAHPVCSARSWPPARACTSRPTTSSTDSKLSAVDMILTVAIPVGSTSCASSPCTPILVRAADAVHMSRARRHGRGAGGSPLLLAARRSEHGAVPCGGDVRARWSRWSASNWWGTAALRTRVPRALSDATRDHPRADRAGSPDRALRKRSAAQHSDMPRHAGRWSQRGDESDSAVTPNR